MNRSKLRRLLERTALIGTDWPMSLGYRICVLTDNPDARPENHVQTSDLRGLLKELGGPDDCSGVYMRLDTNKRLHLIAIFCTEGGERVRDGRLVELVAHECSHVVDSVQELTHAKMCTETRAYTLDWLVGRTCGAVMPHLFGAALLSGPSV